MSGTLDAAQAKGLPIWNAQHWLDFITLRQSARFDALKWENKSLSFDLTVRLQPQDGLSVLIPCEFNQSVLRWVSVDGKAAEYANWAVGGVKYGLVSLEPGSHHLDAGYA